MQRNSLSPEMMTVYRSYATSIRPTPQPEYKIVHKWHSWIQVPHGYLPIKIAQFFRGSRSTGENKLYHWAIFIPTSSRRGVGNYYEVAGSFREGYFAQHFVHVRHGMWDAVNYGERGTHLVGYVAPEYLERLEAHFSLVPVKQGRPEWNCQTWVADALRGLNDPRMYAVQMDYSQWCQQMEIVDLAWNLGDA